MHAALQWLTSRASDLAARLGHVIDGALTDGYLLGAHASAVALDLQPPDWSTWKPGNTAAAQAVLGANGQGEGLKQLLAASHQQISSVAATRLEELARELAGSLDAGDTPATLAPKLRAVLTNPAWAHTVAQTETTRAVSAASSNRYKANGIRGNSWLIAPDQNVCPVCQGNADAGAIGVGQDFPGGVPYPPQHPNCRCALMPEVIRVPAPDEADGAAAA